MAEISLHEYCEQIGDKIQKGRYAEAVAHGRHILKQYPKHVTTYRLLGEAMLEAGQDEYAMDMFRRVLSADPENMIAWVGMSEVYNRRDELNATVWCVERAFELASDNDEVEKELRQLYGRRDGVEPKAAPLTPGALAHLYLKGDLLSRAISELRALLAENPERVDLRVALAEALWRNEQRLRASEVCQAILDELPYCLKANLILGEIWTSSGRGEGQTYLRRAEALDPENEMAQDLFGATSPLSAREVPVVLLEYGLATERELPAWAAEVEGAPAEAPLLTDAEAALVDITTALEAQIEIPSWLEEIAVGEEEGDIQAPVLSSPAVEPPEEHPPENSSAVPFPAEGIPSWLTGPEEVIAEGPAPEASAEEGEPEWLAGLGLEPVDEEEENEEVPDWLSELGIEIEETPATSFGEPEEVPEWMAGLGVEETSPETVSPALPAEQPADWLDSLRGQVAEGLSAPEDVAPVDIRILEMPEAEAPAPPAEEAALPAWIEGEEMPSGDEALAWLEQLAAGKEEALRAQVEAESEARLAEIMGRPEPAGPAPAEVAPAGPPPAPAPAEIPDWIQELAPSEAAAPEAPLPAAEAVPAEAPPPPVGDAFGWMSFGEPGAPPEAALPVEEAPPAAAPGAEAPAPAAEEAALPAWIEGEEMPSGDEALAWLEQLAAGKEEALRAQAEAESEARLAEIMDRPEPAGPAPAEVAPAGPPPAPAPAEIPDWIQELAPSEAAAPEAPPPAAEAVPAEVPPLSVEEPAAPPVGDAFGWMSFGEPGAPPEAALPVEEALPAAAPEAEAPAPAAEEAALPAWIEGEEMPSGDEALAWLEQLAAGKEEALRAQAEAESEARLAEIMGRPEPAGPAPAEVAPAGPPPAPAPAEIPDWIQEVAPSEAAAPEAPPPAAEAVPAEAPPPPVGDAFGWMSFGEPGAPPEAALPAEEIAPIAAEVAPLEAPAEAAPPMAEAPPVVETPAEDVLPALEAPVAAEVLRPLEEAPAAEAIPPAPPPVEAPHDPFAAHRAYLKEHPRDYEAQLAFARTLWQANKREEALEAYSHVIRSGKLLENVIADLEQYLERWPDASIQRLLGDAHMKDGRLQEALDIYRQALETL